MGRQACAAPTTTAHEEVSVERTGSAVLDCGLHHPRSVRAVMEDELVNELIQTEESYSVSVVMTNDRTAESVVVHRHSDLSFEGAKDMATVLTYTAMGWP